ncbi:UreD urease accessory protein-domain-containing protein [Infundibulicybe gibba]|nr:UreD urease accessory protein-domain-containing protein [Infundibulicybe gibba]
MSSSTMLNPPRFCMAAVPAGSGNIVLSSYGSSVAFSELSSAYPLKLLSPRTSQDITNVAITYILSYGGGLVGGDQINLSVKVESNAMLVLLSQGSTKVFKTRGGQRLASVRPDTAKLGPLVIDTDGTSSPPTAQTMDFVVADRAGLFLLPDPVTCFRAASYNQVQTFRLSKDASAVILDWVTSGRMFMGEEWVFSRYYSSNEVWVDDTRVVWDAVLLDSQELDAQLPSRTLGDQLSPYSCYAMIILCGTMTQTTIEAMQARYNQMSELLWSLSSIPMNGGHHGKTTELVRTWLADALRPLEHIIGPNVYRTASFVALVITPIVFKHFRRTTSNEEARSVQDSLKDARI